MSSCVGSRANLCSEPCVVLGNGVEGAADDGVASGWDLEGDGNSLCSVMVGLLWEKGGGAVLQYPLSLCGEDGKTRNGLGVDSNGEGVGGSGTSGRGEGVRMLIEHDPGEEDHSNLGSQEEARTQSCLHQRRTRR